MAFNDVLVNAGIVTLAADLVVGGDLTVSAGTLGIGSNTVFAAGNVTVDAGLTATTGTLEMNGLSGQTLGGAAAIGLYDLSISNPVGVTQATTVTVAGTLDLGGPLDFAGQSLSLAHVIAGAPDDLDADATATLVINGTGSGIVIPSNVGDLLNLAIANASGAALAGPLAVEGVLTLGGGNLDAGSEVVSIGPAGVVSRTSGHVIGQLRKWAPAGSGVMLTFEVGDATAYAPINVVIGTVGVSGQLTASTTPGEHPAIAASILNPARDVNRWWTLVNLGASFDALDATVTFVPADLDPGTQASQLVVIKWDGSWSVPVSGANTATTITAFGMTSLSEFAVGEPAADLQIEKTGPAFVVFDDPAGFDYLISVRNAGPTDNTDGFTVTDTLAASLRFESVGSDPRCTALGQVVTCTRGNDLAGGATDAFVVHVTLVPGIGVGAAISNQASVASLGTSDPDASNDTSAMLLTTVIEVSGAPTPTPTGSLPDASMSQRSDVALFPLPLAVVGWIGLVCALALESGRRRSRPTAR